MIRKIPLPVLALLCCLPMASAQAVRGIVVDAEGTPQAGARVVVVPAPATRVTRHLLSHLAPPARPIAAGTTNARGHFGLDISRMLAPESERYVLWVISDRLADRRLAVGKPDAGELNLGKIILVPSGTIRGAVRTADGKPIAGATVRFTLRALEMGTLPPDRRVGWAATTDAEGHYQILSTPPNRGHLVATAAGRAAERTWAQASIGTTTEKDFALDPGRSVSGVVTAAGAAVPRARVALIEMVEPEPGRPAVPHVIDTILTGANGQYQLQGVGADSKHFLVVAEAVGFLTNRGIHLDPKQDQLRITLERCPTLRLRVRGDQGQVLRRYAVHLLTAPGNFRVGGSRVEQPDQDGVIVLRDLPEGRFHLDIRAPGYAPTLSRAFELLSGRKAPLIEVRADRGSALAGRVVDALGRPVAGAAVQLAHGGDVNNPFAKLFAAAKRGPEASTKTDDDGEFRLRALRPGKYSLTVQREGYADLLDAVTIEDGAAKRDDLVLHKGVRVLGTTVVDGKPCPGVQINFKHRKTGRTFTVTSNPKGAFMFPHRMAPGNYDVMCAEGSKGNPLQMMVQFKKNESVLVVKAGQTVQRFEINVNR